MRSARNLRSIPNLLHERLIHLEEPVRMRPTWKARFAYHGIPESDVSVGMRLNDYALVLQAAQTGEGFAFGWEHIVRDLIDRKLLATQYIEKNCWHISNVDCGWCDCSIVYRHQW